MKFWFATDIKTILYIINNYGRIEIVGILLARVKYLQRLHANYRAVIHIKYHNLCISMILIFLFLVVLYL